MSDESAPASAAAPETNTGESGFAPSPGYANYVLILLFVIYVFNFIDRQILAILLDPIKAELGATDTQMGFLTGLAFAIFYTFAGLPIARVADTGVRRSIIAIGIAVWSAMTVFSGMVTSFPQLALARVGVGVGEAAFVPPAHSLISDYFPPKRRATALAVFSMGIYIGVAMGFLIGGWAAQLSTWRVAFYIVGIPGLALAVVMRLTVREPPRGHSEGVAQVAEAPSIGEVFRFMWKLRSFRHLAFAAALHSFGGYAFANWGPAFFGRVHHMTPGQIGTWLSFTIGLGGAAGSILGGVLSDRLAERDQRWQMYLPAIATLAAIPAITVILLSPAQLPSLLFLIPNSILGAMWFGPIFATTQGLAKLRMRAIAAAILLFVINIIGLGLGPLSVGMMNDMLKPQYGAEAIRYSLLVIVVVNLWAAIHFMLAARTLREDLAAKEQ